MAFFEPAETGALLLYYITARAQFTGTETERRRLLLKKIAEAARCGVDLIQLREKDLITRELEKLAREAAHVVLENSSVTREGERRTRLLINSRCDVAIAAGADGVHLRSDDVSPATAREILKASPAENGAEIFPLIAVSCHREVEVAQAAAGAADFAVLAPIFEKQNSAEGALGLEELHHASKYDIPVLALGGITMDDVADCLNQGADGIAGIRLFQENDIAEIVTRLRGHS